MMTSLRRLPRTLLGRPSDWHLSRPSVRIPRPHLGWVGPLAVVASVAMSWFAFQNAQGEDGNVAFGLFVGAASILLMVWSFILAVRVRFIEPLFGGLDSIYRVHRWAGSISTVLMFLHVRAEPEVEGGIRGASRSVADSAEGLAGTGEIMLYVLVGLSLLRWMPYRWWRWTHKLIGVPFAFACWHFFTAEKPYANGSAWGWWFGGFMIAGLVAWIYRVVARDMASPGVRYRVESMVSAGSATTLELTPTGRPLEYEAGQFAFIKIQAPGLREPHAFTIASSPSNERLRFVIRELGDWTRRMRRTDLTGTSVFVEGPYGTFEPLGRAGQPVVWVAGGVGITPFLAAIDESTRVPDSGSNVVPRLFYAVRSAGENGIVDELRAAERDGRIHLHVFESGDGNRLVADDLVRLAPDLADAHVALCGPSGLVRDMSSAARRAGSTDIEVEDFDIRQGFGPDLSIEVDDLVDAVHGRRS